MSSASKPTQTAAPEISKSAQSNVILFDLSDRTQIEITGADRASFLHSFTSNDIKRLKPGQGCETFVTSLKGKVVGHFFGFCGEQSLWLDGAPGQAETVLAHLRKYVLIEDVQLAFRSADRGELYVSGPMATQLLQLDEGMPVPSQITRETNGESFDVRRVDLFGVPGFLLSIPVAQSGLVKRSLLALGVPEGTRDDFEILRTNAGYPRYGVDITEENLAQEVARTKQCISFNKGCYLGQETIARIDSMGHTNHELRRIQFESTDIPPKGTIIFDATGKEEIGAITSAAANVSTNPVSATRSIIAIGLLKRTALAKGTAVRLQSDDRIVTGQVL